METEIDLKELLIKTAERTKFKVLTLERDFHLTKILHEIAKSNIEALVFKGGTCLSKCYLDLYRLSEDLDFVYNKDIASFSANQTKKILSNLKSRIFSILGSLKFNVEKELGSGWKMLTTNIPQKFVGLEIIVFYNSLIDSSRQKIKIEVSFRKKLERNTIKRRIKHYFYDELNEPILPENIEIGCISLEENLAEKFRALVTRKIIVARDIFDISHILTSNLIKVNKGLIELIIKKINETKSFTKNDFNNFINNIYENSINEKELEAVLRTDLNVDVKVMIRTIKSIVA